MYDDSFEGAFVSWHPETALFITYSNIRQKDSNVVELEHTQEQLAEYLVLPARLYRRKSGDWWMRDLSALQGER